MKKEVIRCEKILQIRKIGGIEAEIIEFLPDGWTYEIEGSCYYVKGNLESRWKWKMWKMIKLLSYSEFLLVEKENSRSGTYRYRMVSGDINDIGFCVHFSFG